MPDRNVPDRDRRLLSRAVELAIANISSTAGGPFAAIIARGDRIVARGVNSVVPDRDPTAHAEIAAIREACRRLDSTDLAGHVLYASCRPCPMCFAAARWAGVDRVVYALSSEDAGEMGFMDAEMHRMLAGSGTDRIPPETRLDLPKAREIVRAWLSKPDRQRY